MEQTLHRPVRLDLELCKSRQSKEAILKGNLDLARMGPLSFLNAREINAGLTPLAQVNAKKDAVIFARYGLGITNLSQLRGRSFAFGDTNATLSLWAKVLLVRVGLCGADLSAYAHLDSEEAYRKEIQQRGFQPEVQYDLTSHSEAIKAVLAGKFDAGVARTAAVTTNLNKELVALQFFDSNPNLWVARGALPAEVRNALKLAFLSMSSNPYRRSFPSGAEEFSEVDEQQLVELERARKTVATLFEVHAPIQEKDRRNSP